MLGDGCCRRLNLKIFSIYHASNARILSSPARHGSSTAGSENPNLCGGAQYSGSLVRDLYTVVHARPPRSVSKATVLKKHDYKQHTKKFGALAAITGIYVA